MQLNGMGFVAVVNQEDSPIVIETNSKVCDDALVNYIPQLLHGGFVPFAQTYKACFLTLLMFQFFGCLGLLM